MKRLMGSAVVLLFLSFFVVLQGAEETEGAQAMKETRLGVTVENAFIEASAGYENQTGIDSTWTGNLGFNHGLPLNRDWGLGFQWGGRVTLRDDEPDWLAGVGVFQRGVDFNGYQMMWGLQGFWQNTHQKVDLAHIKPTLAWQVDDMNYWGLTGLWGKNEDRAKFRVPFLYKQEGVDQAAAFWGHRWREDLATEFMGGYQFNDIDEPVVGATLSWQLDPELSLNLSGSSNFAGDYLASVGVGFDLGANSRTDRLIKVTQDDADDYTPLPIDSMTQPRYNTVKLFR